jgi:hypothetical protein
MKGLLVVAALMLGFSFSSFAQEDTGAGEPQTHEATAPAPAAKAMPAGKKMAAHALHAAKAACKKEGKKGKELAACIKEKRATH